ncbi:LuxR family transcriptional regulator [Novosphingobium sp.]|uniref:LuxR family transcriptional regulator n=1 Tax=Novosphingobium sp. TaxID=1874826 RepID=UPI003D0AEB86
MSQRSAIADEHDIISPKITSHSPAFDHPAHVRPYRLRRSPQKPRDTGTRDIVRFNTELRSLTTAAACADLFRSAIAPFGFDTFSCGEVDLRDRNRCVFTIIAWSDRWQDFYIKSGLIHHDPIIKALETRREPFTWSDLRRDRAMARFGTRALDLAAKEGWTEGLVVPIPQSGNRMGLVSLAGNNSAIAKADMDYICVIAVLLAGHVRALAPAQGFAQPPMGLTEREIVSLRLVAIGLPDAQIAARMGVSTSTAHEFVEKAKRRMNAKSRAEMVALAVAMGVIDI